MPGVPESRTSRSTTAEYLAWDAARAGLTVRIDLAVVDRIAFDVLEGFKAVPRRGLEVGGLLLGRAEAGDGSAVLTVDDYVPLPSEHQRGPSFLLSDADMARLQGLAREHPDAVGFFRSDTRNTFEATDADAAVMRDLFGNARRPLLLIRPTPNGSTARMWVWGDGVLWPLPEGADFPFSAERLATGDFPVVRLSRPEPKRAEARRSAVLPPLVDANLPAPPRRLSRPVWLAAAALSACLAFVAFRISHRPSPVPVKPTTAASTPAHTPGPLGMNVERSESVLRVSWDRNAPALAHAARAVLWITDGGSLKHITLEPAELASGSVLYSPATPDVAFRLEVFTPERSVNESVRAYGLTQGTQQPERPSPAPPPERQPPPVNRASRKSSAPPSRPKPAAEPRQEAANKAPDKPSPFAPANAPTPLAQEPSAARSPAPAGQPVESAAAKPARAVAPFTVTVEAEPAKASRIRRLFRRFRGKDKTVPPKIVHQVNPVVPPAVGHGIESEVPVDVRVYVDEAGRVEYAEPVSFPGLDRHLTMLAVYSARKWEFAPARNEGRAVPAEVILHFRFTPKTVASR